MSDWVGRNLHSLPKRGEFCTQTDARLLYQRYLLVLEDLVYAQRVALEKGSPLDEFSRKRVQEASLLKEELDVAYVRDGGRWVRAFKFCDAFMTHYGHP